MMQFPGFHYTQAVVFIHSNRQANQVPPDTEEGHSKGAKRKKQEQSKSSTARRGWLVRSGWVRETVRGK